MNKLTIVLSQGKSLIPFITCGDPDLQTTAAVVREMAAAGADVVALGIPFSDPTAEGPVVQGANIRALAAATTTDRIFALVRELRANVDVPLLFVTYANVVFSYGAERFISTCRDIDVDGLILYDLPFEEKDEFQSVCDAHQVTLVSMVAPTEAERIAMIAKEAEGFLYAMAVTDNDALAFTVNAARQQSTLPCIVGLPECTAEQAKEITTIADGILLETAVVKLMETYGKDAAPHVGAAIRTLKAAMNE